MKKIMCIIVLKSKKAKLPPDDVLEECFISNPHGAGYMYREHNQIIIHKGFMKFDSFLTSLHANVGKKKIEVCLHFRVATHGTVKPMNCHPFPITSELQPLHDINVVCTRALCHNGILSGYGDTKRDISDSAFLAKMLYPCRTEQQYTTVLNRHSGSSRFVVMTGQFTIVSGNFIAEKGCLFSNDSYKPMPINQYVYDGINEFCDMNYVKSKYPVHIRDVPNTTQKQLSATVLDEGIESEWHTRMSYYDEDRDQFFEARKRSIEAWKKEHPVKIDDDGFKEYLDGNIP